LAFNPSGTRTALGQLSATGGDHAFAQALRFDRRSIDVSRARTIPNQPLFLGDPTLASWRLGVQSLRHTHCPRAAKRHRRRSRARAGATIGARSICRAHARSPTNLSALAIRPWRLGGLAFNPPPAHALPSGG